MIKSIKKLLLRKCQCSRGNHAYVRRDTGFLKLIPLNRYWWRCVNCGMEINEHESFKEVEIVFRDIYCAG